MTLECAILQATERNYILTPEDLHKWAKEYIRGITFFYITQKEIKAHVLRPTDRLQYAKTVPSTRSHHKFVPINTSELKMYFLSSDKEDVGTKVSVTGLTDVAVHNRPLMSRKVCCCCI
jgi:hypothetical protein